MAQKRTAWIVMLTAFLAGLAVTVNLFKVPPALPSLLPEFGIDMATGGWLMSISSVAAIVLSIPVALLLFRVGLKRAGLVALAFAVAGSVLGAVARDATTLLISRLVEGVGMSIVAVVSPALISLWFEPRERGLPMGIWAAWVPAGNVVMYNAAPVLEAALGWRGIWWFGALFALAVLVLFALQVRLPRRPDDALPPPPSPLAAARDLLNPASWFLALTFGTFVFGQLGYSTWAPSFLTGVLAFPAAAASFFTSLIFLAGIAANLSAGWLMDRVPHRLAVPAAAMAVTGLFLWWGFRLSAAAVVPYMLALGFISNVIPSAVFTLAPETVKRPESIGLAVAAINVVSNMGLLLGPPLVGAAVAGDRWAAGSGLLVAITAAGVLAALLAWRAMSAGRG